MRNNKDWRSIFGEEEWRFISKLGASLTDPEEKRSFWETVKDKKEADPDYSIFTDFPKEEKTVSEKQRIANYYCKQIFTMMGRGKQDVEEKEE